MQAEKIPRHEFIQIIGNSHCTEGSVVMKVDGEIEWMQPCRGTHHFRTVVNHRNERALVEFLGAQGGDSIIIEFK